ncbi:MAG: hypothetical protein FWC41_03160 [Firmicutes bacterium]|nr:hypothetical protein [Bacillota bacterium]
MKRLILISVLLCGMFSLNAVGANSNNILQHSNIKNDGSVFVWNVILI